MLLFTSKTVPSLIVTSPASQTPSDKGTGRQSFLTSLHSNQSEISSEFVMVALSPTI